MVSPGDLLLLGLKTKALPDRSNLPWITLIWVPARSKLRLLGSKTKNSHLDKELEKRNRAKREARRRKKRLKSLKTTKKSYNRRLRSHGMI